VAEGRGAAGDGLAQPAVGPAHSAETPSGFGSYTQHTHFFIDFTGGKQCCGSGLVRGMDPDPSIIMQKE
jgi:hypothetical protein